MTANHPAEALTGCLKALAALLNEQGLTLATAESCTGGLVGSLITSLPGSSRYYKGGIITYANEAKVALLGVAQDLLDREGAVCAQVARDMARGAARALDSDVALGITGIAGPAVPDGPDGPAGDASTKPVGLVYIGLYDRGREQAQSCLFAGDREEIRRQAAEKALAFLLAALAP